MKLKLLLPVVLLLLLGACRHKQAQPEMIYVDSATRQHFAFKPGSYWIYKDSVSGREDSCYVTALDSSTLANNDNTKIYQSIFSNMIQRPLIDAMSDSIKTVIGLGDGFIAFRFNITRFLEEEDFGLLLPYPFKLGYMGYSNDSCTVISNTPDTVVVGKHYFNVISCLCIKYKNKQNFAWLLINDSVGIVQMSIYSDNIITRKWELQRHLIIK